MNSNRYENIIKLIIKKNGFKHRTEQPYKGTTQVSERRVNKTKDGTKKQWNLWKNKQFGYKMEYVK